ncbi:MAG: cytochrome b/b6 domain-containing protein [Anaerolineales bacterium]|jgi:cytochrome b subunit of formate dehydrogenase
MDDQLIGRQPQKPENWDNKVFIRFDLVQRVSHLVMLVSFSFLAITGLPQRFPESSLSQGVLNAFGGIESARQVHHVSAVILGAVSLFHVLDVVYRIYVLRIPITILPAIEDFKHLYQDILYYLGFRKRKAYYGRYNYAEKAEYFAVVWGIVLMGITGFLMWNPIASTRYLPGQIIPAAKTAHGMEAILAVLALIVWHFYHVHLKYFNKSMFTGKIKREEMEDEHPGELAQIERGEAWQAPPEEVIQKRRRLYFPLAAVFSIIFGLGLFEFATFETTAITTVPKAETAQVFVPLTPTPRPTPLPTETPELKEGVAEESWDGKYSALFRNRCGSCHGVTSVGGLSLETYQKALAGGNSGPAIVPGDPDASVLIQVQSTGGHPGQLTIDELNQVIEWITSGAPER